MANDQKKREAYEFASERGVEYRSGEGELWGFETKLEAETFERLAKDAGAARTSLSRDDGRGAPHLARVVWAADEGPHAAGAPDL